MADLRKLLDGATPGPWDIDPHGIDDCFGDVWFGEEARVCENASAADASLIAMAPDLAAEVIALREREARLVAALRAENAALAAKLAEAMRALRNTPCDCDNKEIGRWVYHIPCSRCEALARIEKMGGGDEPNSRTAPRGTVTGSGIGTHSERRGLGDGRAESDWPRLQRTWRLAAVVER